MPVEQINHSSPLNSSSTLKTCPVVRGYPVVGVLPKLLLNPLQLLEQIVKEYPGEVVAIKIGPVHVYLATHPNYAKYVLNDNWQNFSRGKLKYKVVRKILGNSVLTNEGESWFRIRQLMQPLFTANQANAFTELTVKLIADSILNLEVSADNSLIYVEKEMSLLTQSVLLGIMFGSSITASQARNVAEAIKVLTREISRRIFLSFLPDWLPLPREKAICNAIKTIDDIILPLIRTRRKSKEDHNDLLNRLLHACDTETNTGMNDQQLRDECIGMYLAGFEATSNTLTWIWYLLDKHPEVEHKLRTEIDAVLGKRQPTSSDIAKLQYTKMVIQEAMRLYPSSWFGTRVLQAPDEIGGYSLKAGETVLLSSYLTHRLPQFWSQPEVFDPERFDPEHSKQLHPYAYFPFGGGPHLCLAKHFALMEMQLIIVMLMQKYRLRCVPGHLVVPSYGITLRLRYGLRMTLEPIVPPVVALDI